MPNVVESPKFEAIIRAGAGNSFFVLTMPQTAIVYPQTNYVLIRDAGLHQGTIGASNYSLLRDAGVHDGIVDAANFNLLESESNGPYQANLDLLKSETVRSDGNKDLIGPTPIDPPIEFVIATATDVPYNPARVPRSGGSVSGF